MFEYGKMKDILNLIMLRKGLVCDCGMLLSKKYIYRHQREQYDSKIITGLSLHANWQVSGTPLPYLVTDMLTRP